MKLNARIAYSECVLVEWAMASGSRSSPINVPVTDPESCQQGNGECPPPPKVASR